MKISLYIMVLFLLCALVAHAQVDTLWQHRLLEEVEGLVEELEVETMDYLEEVADVERYKESKLNLNALNAEEAYTILQFTDYQYYQLLRYIDRYGELITVYELAAVEGFSREDVERVWPWVEVRPRKSGKRRFVHFFQQSKQMLLLRYGQVVEPQAGYEQGRASGYLGSPVHLTCKYSFQSGEHFAMALACEKDAGEQFFRGYQKQGFDHYAFYLNLKDVGVCRNVVLGNYKLHFGQGLIFGTALMSGRGGSARQVRQFPTLLRAAAPMSESNAFTGAAAVLGNSRYVATLFYGQRRYDGTLTRDADGNGIYEGSFSYNGYHRTQHENEQRGRLQSHTYGANFTMRSRLFTWGATFAATDFSATVEPSSAAYRKYAAAGKHLYNAGANYQWILYKSILFGECAVSSTKGCALLQGLYLPLDPRVNVVVLWRYYDKRYAALQAAAFGTQTRANNEMGAYLATDILLGRNITLYLNADLYRFPWLKYKVDAPSLGFDFTAKCQFGLPRRSQLSIRYRYRSRYQNDGENRYYNIIKPTQRHLVGVVLQLLPDAWLTMKSEINAVHNVHEKAPPTFGWCVAQDMDLLVERWQMGCKVRIALFDTDGYDERVGLYEKDLLYTFVVNNHYGRGVRYYLMWHYRYRFMRFQLKWAQTRYDGQSTIGSGNTLIQGSVKSELKMQIIFSF